MRTLVAVLLLLALASTGLAAYGDAEAPTRFLRVELLDGGVMAMPIAEQFRVLRFDYEFSRWRVGVAAMDMGNALGGGDFGHTFFGGFVVPDVGYLLYRQPKRTTFFYGMVPSIWAEAASVIPVTPFNMYPAARVDCRAEADYYGVGFGVEAGVNAGYTVDSDWFVWPYLRLGVILGVANFGF